MHVGGVGSSIILTEALQPSKSQMMTKVWGYCNPPSQLYALQQRDRVKRACRRGSQELGGGGGA